MILLSHPTGTTPARHAALGLQHAGLLGEFWNVSYTASVPWYRRILSRKASAPPLERVYPSEISDKIRTIEWRYAPNSRGSGTFQEEAALRSLDQSVAQRLSSAEFSGIYAYEGGAESGFRTARDLQELCIYDKPSIHWKAAQELLREERELQPQWTETLEENFPGNETCARRDMEISLADVIFVPSVFAKNMIERYARNHARIAVVPFGPISPPSTIAQEPRTPSARLRVLYVGPLTQRRGLSYLFAAMQQLEGAAELTVAGQRPARTCSVLDQELSNVTFVDTPSAQEILQLMNQNDVLVVPSLFEDSGSELLDAMTLGLPVIATPNSAAPDLVTDGSEGFIVPIRSAQAIAERLHFLVRERAQLAEMSQRAASRAREFNWIRYETTLATRVSEALAIAGRGPCSSYARATPPPRLPGVVPFEQRR